MFRIFISGTSKGAVDQLTRMMALELGPHQVRINIIVMQRGALSLNKIELAPPPLI